MALDAGIAFAVAAALSGDAKGLLVGQNLEAFEVDVSVKRNAALPRFVLASVGAPRLELEGDNPASLGFEHESTGEGAEEASKWSRFDHAAGFHRFLDSVNGFAVGAACTQASAFVNADKRLAQRRREAAFEQFAA